MKKPQTKSEEIRMTGIGASPGICIGKAYLVDSEGVDIVEKYYISEKNLKDEVRRFKAAVNQVNDELRAIIEDTPEELKQHAYIVETHMLLLKDKMLYDRTIATIEKEHVNAEWALRKVVSHIKPMFQSMSDDYLRERASDILQVADRVTRNLVGVRTEKISEIDKRVILVARDLSPAETSQIQLERIKGFITNRGGKASHTGIIARTLEIPAVVGLKKATGIIDNDDIIVVDGTAGVVIIHPSEKTLLEYEDRKYRYEERRAAMSRQSHLPAETLDGHSLQIMGNIELPEEVVSVIDNGGDGIGLYRTEFQYLSRPNFPGEQELFDKYRDVVEVMAPRAVTIRTLDINGDKAVAHRLRYEEENPALGLRGIRYCLSKPEVFVTQLRAILRAAAFGNVRIMFPMISCYEEIVEAKRIFNETADALEREGVACKRDIPVGMMMEVPSAVMMADLMAKEVDFFSIGTNDLIQYSLAIDRGNREVAHLYRPLHPAVLRMIRHVVEVAHAENIEVYMCGQMSGEPIHAPILVALGLHELSMNPQSIPLVKQFIRSLSLKDAQQFMAEVYRQKTAADVLALMQDAYGDILAEKVFGET